MKQPDEYLTKIIIQKTATGWRATREHGENAEACSAHSLLECAKFVFSNVLEPEDIQNLFREKDNAES